MTRIRLRTAEPADLPVLRQVMDRAIAQLMTDVLSPAQIAASAEIMGLDVQLIEDGTYIVAELDGAVAACGGWSRRATTHGGDHSAGRDARLLDPATEPARVRAMYADPAFARRGAGRAILAEAERRAAAEGFRLGTLVATLAGEPLYRAAGWRETARWEARTSTVPVPVLTMEKSLSSEV
ncbi:MAG: GNAT family N-acetyltransferase [Pseudomonadota bacterium]